MSTVTKRVLSPKISDLRPIGSIILYGSSVPPAGTLLCDGASYLISNYPMLYSIIGTSFTTFENGLNFNVPNLSGQLPLSKGTIYFFIKYK
jgi:microcystin-dependent protein